MGRHGIPGLVVLAVAGAIALGGCSWLGVGGGEKPEDPFASGVLNTAANQAPPQSDVQFLATLAAQLGWEADVTQDLLLRKAIEEEAFDERVAPRLLGLFFQKGFSVLPKLGEGHEFTRDTLVQGDVGNSRYLVRTREPIRIIFLGLAENIVIVYPKDGHQPQVFNRRPASTVALRESRLAQYLD